MVTLLALFLVASTYAKYTSTATGSDVAKVAKWSFKVGGQDITKSTEIEFNLFDTITNGDADENKEATVEAGVKKAVEGEDPLIAPGTGGAFEMEVENASEVAAEYKVTYSCEKTDANIPIQFSYDKQTWYDDITALSDLTTKKLNYGETGTTQKIYWRWVFEKMDGSEVDTARDQMDTKIGTNTDVETGEYKAHEVKVKATIVASQRDNNY